MNLAVILIFLTAALVSLPISQWLGLGTIIGYLIAGMVIGPSGTSLIDSNQAIFHFSEIGIVLFLFLVGLELEPKRLWKLKNQVFFGGSCQLAFTVLCLSAAFYFVPLFGKSIPVCVLSSFAFALSSDAIALQTLAERRLLRSRAGETAFSILLFQDFAAFPALALLPILASGSGSLTLGNGNSWWSPLRALLIFGLLVFVMAKSLRFILRFIVSFDSREIFVMFALLFVVGMAFGAEEVGLSAGLGALLAGVLLADSEYRHALQTSIEPFKGLLLGLFFISIGMSIELPLAAKHWAPILVLTALLTVAKFFGTEFLARFMKIPPRQRFAMAFCLVPVSEFAFVIVASGKELNLFHSDQATVLNLVTILSMLLSPPMMAISDRLRKRFTRKKKKAKKRFDTIENIHPEVIIAGFGRFGQIIGRFLSAHRITATVLDIQPSQIELLRKFGFKVYYGDATRLDLLEAAGIREAKILVVAVDNVESALKIVDIVKLHFPHISIFSRARNVQHIFDLFDRGVADFERETFESSLKLGGSILRHIGFPAYQVERAMHTFRGHNNRTIAANFEHRHDEKLFTSNARRATLDLENMLQADLDQFGHQLRGWSSEADLRLEASLDPKDSRQETN